MGKPVSAAPIKKDPYRNRDEPLSQQTLNTVFDPCLIGSQSCAVSAHLAQKPGRPIRDPYLRKKVTPKQLGQHFGIDLVGLGFCFSNRLSLERMGSCDF